jgi:cyclomaltodextrinase
MVNEIPEGTVELRPGKYRHFKGGEYEVQGIASHSESGEQLVVYRPLYGEGGLWVRPLSMFLETVERDGETQLRFTFVGEVG